jgi:hypothetical protein
MRWEVSKPKEVQVLCRAIKAVRVREQAGAPLRT